MNRFLRLIRNMLKAGYLEDWTLDRQRSAGCPQGGVVSPVLSNIYLHKLDEFVETVLIPEYTRGTVRKRNPDYSKVKSDAGSSAQRGDRASARKLRRADASPAESGTLMIPTIGGCGTAATPTITSWDSSDRRPKPSGSKISWRRSCATNSRWNCQRRQDADHARPHPGGAVPRLRDHRTARQPQDHRTGSDAVNGKIALRVPLDVIRAKRAAYRRHGKPDRTGRPCRTSTTTTSSRTYGAEYRGIVQYYLLAIDVWRIRRVCAGTPRRRCSRPWQPSTSPR